MSGERARWWLMIALALSVFANLFFAGVLVGRISFPFERRAPGALVTRERLQQLPAEERRAFNAVMRRHAPETRAARERLRAARNALADAIATPRYDRAVVEARFEDLRRAAYAQQKAQNQSVAEALATLSAPSRVSISQAAKDDIASVP